MVGQPLPDIVTPLHHRSQGAPSTAHTRRLRCDDTGYAGPARRVYRILQRPQVRCLGTRPPAPASRRVRLPIANGQLPIQNIACRLQGVVPNDLRQSARDRWRRRAPHECHRLPQGRSCEHHRDTAPCPPSPLLYCRRRQSLPHQSGRSGYGRTHRHPAP